MVSLTVSDLDFNQTSANHFLVYTKLTLLIKWLLHCVINHPCCIITLYKDLLYFLFIKDQHTLCIMIFWICWQITMYIEPSLLLYNG